MPPTLRYVLGVAEARLAAESRTLSRLASSGPPLIECQGRRAVKRLKVAYPPFTVRITPAKAEPIERLLLCTRDVAVRQDENGEGERGLDGPTLSVATLRKRQERS